MNFNGDEAGNFDYMSAEPGRKRADAAPEGTEVTRARGVDRYD